MDIHENARTTPHSRAEMVRRHGISRLPDTEGGKPKKVFKAYPIGYFHIDIAEVRTKEGKLFMFVAVAGPRRPPSSNCVSAPTQRRLSLSSTISSKRCPMRSIPS